MEMWEAHQIVRFTRQSQLVPLKHQCLEDHRDGGSGYSCQPKCRNRIPLPSRLYLRTLEIVIVLQHNPLVSSGA
eukprot:3970221-Pyramimonas_sp.AAC.2